MSSILVGVNTIRFEGTLFNIPNSFSNYFTPNYIVTELHEIS